MTGLGATAIAKPSSSPTSYAANSAPAAGLRRTAHRTATSTEHSPSTGTTISTFPHSTDRGLLRLGALAWAAAGKDEGLNPVMIIEMAERFARYRQADLDSLALNTPLDIVKLSEKWREAIGDAKQFVAALPAEEVGCAYLDESGTPTIPIPDAADQSIHRGTVGGAWPKIAE